MISWLLLARDPAVLCILIIRVHPRTIETIRHGGELARRTQLGGQTRFMTMYPIHTTGRPAGQLVVVIINMIKK